MSVEKDSNTKLMNDYVENGDPELQHVEDIQLSETDSDERNNRKAIKGFKKVYPKKRKRKRMNEKQIDNNVVAKKFKYDEHADSFDDDDDDENYKKLNDPTFLMLKLSKQENECLKKENYKLKTANEYLTSEIKKSYTEIQDLKNQIKTLKSSMINK